MTLYARQDAERAKVATLFDAFGHDLPGEHDRFFVKAWLAGVPFVRMAEAVGWYPSRVGDRTRKVIRILKYKGTRA